MSETTIDLHPKFSTDAESKPKTVILSTVTYITLLVRANATDPLLVLLPFGACGKSKQINKFLTNLNLIDIIPLNKITKSSGMGEIPYRRYSPRA